MVYNYKNLETEKYRRRMKKFFVNYSFYAVKMFLNQFAISLLGLTLSGVFSRAELSTGQLVSSICAVVFYLFLIYYMTWELGYNDRIAEGHGHIVTHPLTGLFVSLLANSLNFIFAVLILCRVAFGSFCIIIEGMYAGIIITVANGGTAPTWLYFAIIAPALIVSTLSYYLGLHDICFTPLFRAKCPERADKKERKKK